MDNILVLYYPICLQFSLTAPSGMFSVKGFQETFSDMASLAFGTEHMPDLWTTIGQDKVSVMLTI